MHPLVAVILIIGGMMPVFAFTTRKRGHWFGLILLFLLGAFTVVLLENIYIRLPFLRSMIWEGPDFVPILIAFMLALGTTGIISLIIYENLSKGEIRNSQTTLNVTDLEIENEADVHRTQWDSEIKKQISNAFDTGDEAEVEWAYSELKYYSSQGIQEADEMLNNEGIDISGIMPDNKNTIESKSSDLPTSPSECDEHLKVHQEEKVAENGMSITAVISLLFTIAMIVMLMWSTSKYGAKYFSRETRNMLAISFLSLIFTGLLTFAYAFYQAFSTKSLPSEKGRARQHQSDYYDADATSSKGRMGWKALLLRIIMFLVLSVILAVPIGLYFTKAASPILKKADSQNFIVSTHSSVSNPMKNDDSIKTEQNRRENAMGIELIILILVCCVSFLLLPAITVFIFWSHRRSKLRQEMTISTGNERNYSLSNDSRVADEDKCKLSSLKTVAINESKANTNRVYIKQICICVLVLIVIGFACYVPRFQKTVATKSPLSQNIHDYISGEWATALEVTSGLQIHYVISLSPQHDVGTLVVVSEGEEVARHEFDIIDANTIQIKNATGDSFKGEGMFGREMQEMVELRNPPRTLCFRRNSEKVDKYTVYMHGLIEVDSKSIPLTLYRVPEEEEALRIPPRELLKVPLMGLWSVTIMGTPSDYFYSFSEKDNKGIVLTLTKDGVLARHEFYAIGPSCIRIKGAEGKGASGDLFTAEEIVRLVLLTHPPETMRFVSDGIILEVHGIFKNFPITLTPSGG